MSGIAVTEDAVNLYYYLKAKQVVSHRDVCSPQRFMFPLACKVLIVALSRAVPLGNLEDQ